ncbi:hypothetical protein GHT06_005072 [Daphnia sinensis]|uniref:Uncharacterized protein n=1 Tax=Daphnia sinensis TaxID=1820382 RepID=A0AAD5KDC7_9CRUS|nr:hypothetical protein GHT06_004461 [Daphnia sinensis]KAI9550802.1 hypothetical protein GHT06_005072 [Daphnia sinensis]
MLVHVASIPCPATVVIRTSDTDVLVIALGNSSKFPDCQLYLEVGHKRNNTLRFIDITSLSMKLGSTLCKALSGFHAFTGSDYTPAFSYKGKVRPLKILEKNDKYMEAFGLLGSSESLSTALVSDIEEFVCEIANCICSIWNHANEKKPSIFNPEKNGWILRDNKFTPNWFIGELTPPTLQDMLAPEEVIDSEDDEDTTSHCEENEFDGDSTFEDE